MDKRTAKITKAGIVLHENNMGYYSNEKTLRAKYIKIDIDDIRPEIKKDTVVFFLSNYKQHLEKGSILQEHLQSFCKWAYESDGDDFISDFNARNKTDLYIELEVTEDGKSDKYKITIQKLLIASAHIARTKMSNIELDFNRSLVGNGIIIAGSRKKNKRGMNTDEVSFVSPIKESLSTIKMPRKVTSQEDVKTSFKNQLMKYYDDEPNKIKDIIEFDSDHYNSILESKPMGRNPIDKDAIRDRVEDVLGNELCKLFDNGFSTIRTVHLNRESSQVAKAAELYSLLQEHPTVNTIVMTITGPIEIKEQYNTEGVRFTLDVNMTKKLDVKGLRKKLKETEKMAERSRESINKQTCKLMYKSIKFGATERRFAVTTHGNIIDKLYKCIADGGNASYGSSNKTEVKFHVDRGNNKKTRKAS